MVQVHPNVELLRRFDPADPAGSNDLFADDAVWHYSNPNLPELQGDYFGPDGVRSFFQRVGEVSHGTFKIEPVSITPVGDELVVVQVRDTLTFQGTPRALDVVVVWRIVDGRVAEVWDIVPGKSKEAQDAAL